MATAKMYGTTGLTIHSHRGTAIMLMCKCVTQAGGGGVLGRADQGTIRDGYTAWKALGHSAKVLSYGSFSARVRQFMPLYHLKMMDAFRLLDSTDISVTEAASIGTTVTDAIKRTAKRRKVD